MEIKDWVRAARRHKKLTLEQLGVAVGRSKANVGHWETGLHKPAFDQLRAISKATGYDLALLNDDGSAAFLTAKESHPTETLVAQALSYNAISIPLITREDLMLELKRGRELPPKFEVVLWDDAMAPKAPRGTPATFVAVGQRVPQIGDAVLLILNGDPHIRVLRQAATGGMVATPTDANYAAFDISMPGLFILAVLESLGGGWANLTR